jgi:hypothetical protein
MLIQLYGDAGVGKDTLANMIVDRLGWRKLSYATKLKEALIRLDPIVIPGCVHSYRISELLERSNLDIVKRNFPEVRQLLERMGTEVGRDLFGQDFWIKQTLTDISGDVVISDGRFQEDANAARALGGILVRVERVVPSLGGPDHRSRGAHWDIEMDYVIRNDGTEEDLWRRFVSLGLLP